MAKIWTKLALVGLCGWFALGVGAVHADGLRLGLWPFVRPLIGVPHFGGPRYDGPRAYDYDVEPDLRGPRPDERGRMLEPRPPGPHACYSPAETRERVVSQKLREPFELMRKAATMTHAEALTGKLCHWKDIDIYEISLLRPNGRLIHVYMNATTGAVVGALNTH